MHVVNITINPSPPVLGFELRAYTLSLFCDFFFLPRLASNHDPPDLCLLSSWDYSARLGNPFVQLNYANKVKFKKIRNKYKNANSHSYGPHTENPLSKVAFPFLIPNWSTLSFHCLPPRE
jgi:hypothetical protein